MLLVGIACANTSYPDHACPAGSPYTLPPPPDGWSFIVEGFDTPSLARAACLTTGGGVQYECPVDYPFCTLNPGYYACLNTLFDDHIQYVAYACADPCAVRRAELDATCGETGYILDEETCEGQCVGCPDSDDDGVKDACDFCPDNPDYGLKKRKIYTVPKNTICGTYLYEGENCGYSIVQCDGKEEFHPILDSYIDAHEMWRCCKSVVEEEQCVVDKDCNPDYEGAPCECPDKSIDCAVCDHGKCTCPDTDDDGQPNSPCDDCQMDGCTCPDTNLDGQPDSPCLDCQDEDGDGQPDGGGGTTPPTVPPPTPGDTDGDGKPDNEDPCPNNPDPNCEPGDDDGDGIPDDKDPCPGNPDPNCTTTCLTTLDKFRAWASTSESFPFNWAFAIKNMFGPLTSVNPALPDTLGNSLAVPISSTVTGQTVTLDFGEGYTVIRNSPVVTAIAPAVALLRWAMGITIIFYMLPYFVARWHNIHGVSR